MRMLINAAPKILNAINAAAAAPGDAALKDAAFTLVSRLADRYTRADGKEGFSDSTLDALVGLENALYADGGTPTYGTPTAPAYGTVYGYYVEAFAPYTVTA